MLVLTLLLALASPYDDSRSHLEKARLALAKQPHSSATRAQARSLLLRWVDDVAFPSWAGTQWDFNGMSTTPGQGLIACGYYVSTVLGHAGVRLQRIHLSQQDAATITRSVAAGSQVDELSTATDTVQRARERGSGLFVVGLDNHVGFLRVDGERADFCHASYVGPVAVLCEPALESPAFHSSRFVLANALSDALVDLWLQGRALQTLRPAAKVSSSLQPAAPP